MTKGTFITTIIALISFSDNSHAEPFRHIPHERNVYGTIDETDNSVLQTQFCRKNKHAASCTPRNTATPPTGGVDNPDVHPIKPATASTQITGQLSSKGVKRDDPPPYDNGANEQRSNSGTITTQPVRPPIVEPTVNNSHKPL
jgi:hypothetical protein